MTCVPIFWGIPMWCSSSTGIWWSSWNSERAKKCGDAGIFNQKHGETSVTSVSEDMLFFVPTRPSMKNTEEYLIIVKISENDVRLSGSENSTTATTTTNNNDNNNNNQRNLYWELYPCPTIVVPSYRLGLKCSEQVVVWFPLSWWIFDHSGSQQGGMELSVHHRAPTVLSENAETFFLRTCSNFHHSLLSVLDTLWLFNIAMV